jgi:hypothetical protein
LAIEEVVARSGDMCDLFDLPGTDVADDLKHKLDVLRSHCEEASRDYATIEKTVSAFVDTDKDPARAALLPLTSSRAGPGETEIAVAASADEALYWAPA